MVEVGDTVSLTLKKEFGEEALNTLELSSADVRSPKRERECVCVCVCVCLYEREISTWLDLSAEAVPSCYFATTNFFRDTYYTFLTLPIFTVHLLTLVSFLFIYYNGLFLPLFLSPFPFLNAACHIHSENNRKRRQQRIFRVCSLMAGKYTKDA